MRIYICLMLVSAAPAFSTVDIAGYWDGVFVVWDSAPGITSLDQIGGTYPAVEFGLSQPSLGFALIESMPVLVLATSSLEPGIADSLFLVSPVDFQVVWSREVAADAFTPLYVPSYSQSTIQISRHQNEPDAFFLSSDPSLISSGESELNIISARMSCDSPAGIFAVDTLGADLDSWYSGIQTYTRPVCCNSGPPVQMWTFAGSYGVSFMTHYAGVHVQDGASVPGDFDPMMYEHFYSPEMGVYISGEIRAIGSCFGEALGFWTTQDDEELWYSLFDQGSCTASLSAQAPYSIPVSGALAMTCNPVDYGLLLVWQHGDQIRCAHWDGEWNQYWHTVETGVSSISNGNLAVYSDYDGYWIAWSSTYDDGCSRGRPLASRDAPEIRYISRDSVTSIEEPSTSPLMDELSVSPNPVFPGSFLTVTSGSAWNTGTVELFDLSGRTTVTTGISSSGSTSLSTEGLQPGTYFIRVSAGETEFMEKVVLLR